VTGTLPQEIRGGFELPDEGRLAGLKRNFKKARRFAKIAQQRRQRRSG
jgi:hypothetical protein